ncbi:MAG: ATP-binding protein [Verrucomicrobiota bacterium]
MEKILAQALGQDVSQLAAAEKQHLLSRLLARLAHEIRNPLSSLDIHVQLLEEDLARQAPEIRDRLLGRLEIIHGELHRLENIVQQFLRLAGSSELNLELIDIPKAVRHVGELLRPEAAARQIEIVLRLAEDLPPLMADAGQLTQALLNLVINALQAIEQRGRIELRVEQAGGFIAFQVQDTGPGVPAEKAGTIFEPYFTTKQEGSGLGLWIVQQIATAHRGAIDVTSGPGGGAVFSLRLPASGQESTGG